MAKVRGDVHQVLTRAVSERALKFPPTAIDKVLARGLGDEICSFDGGLLLRYLPSADVIKLLLGSAEPDLWRCCNHASSRLAGLDTSSLRALAEAFQPGAPGTAEILHEQSGGLRGGGEWTTSSYVEFYLKVLLELRKRRKEEVKDGGDTGSSGTIWRVTGMEMLSVSSTNGLSSSASATKEQEGVPSSTLSHGASNDDGGGKGAESSAAPTTTTTTTFQSNSMAVQRFSATLPSAFTELYGMYNITNMIQHCLVLGDCDSAAYLYALSNHLDEAFVMRLRALRDVPAAARDSGGSDNPSTSPTDLAAELCAELTAILSVLTSRRQNDTASQKEERGGNDAGVTESVKSSVAKILAPFFSFWSSRNLDTTLLETLLVDHMATVALPLMDLIHDSTRSPALENELRGVLVRLSPSFYAALRTTAARNDASTSTNRPRETVANVDVTDQQLWAEISQNLDKGVATRLFASVDANTSGRRGEGDDVVFTCGHTYAKRVFSEHVLPELRQRLMKLPQPLPESARLLCQEYARPFICLSCPLCVYNTVRREQGGEPWIDIFSYERGYD
eukprot:m.70321 g.70321  ORF g.70321 m.70321 type:complete len:563 (-) comp8639_c1_seq1:8-1696(-)